ncbi:class I SAM-dependent methyltransferase [Streptacidiphilus jiangxiensis]|uniref:Methyltransferase domain-containing protein n=1 Tax=Streptacidiphilus jiangxiensis TaxID=235985 RepID=A0A1H7T0G3_STRJI|nr:class I SAM-dependent methyltransferase [Streptacidiphilus jiangxiensis]SEL78412.1 Methyltransferase domain-containing protein [Streptacidiphilus jiangxiensis]
MTDSSGELTVPEMIHANRRNWDARTPVHTASAFYGLDGSRRPDDWFAPFEWTDLGELRGRSVLHLQCHLGAETQAFSLRGAAPVVGLDLSGASVAEARKLAAGAGLDTGFVQADVYDAVAALDGRRFDVVYTGKGALCYLPDLDRWASVVRELLAPGGLLYVVEFHPLLNALGPVPDPDEQDGELRLRNDYLGGRGPERHASGRTYTDGPSLERDQVSYEWRHGIGDVVDALVGAGLRLESLRETDLLPWPRFAAMTRDESGWWRLPGDRPRVPLMFALRATRPA